MSSNISGVTQKDLYIISAAATGAAINQTNNAEELKNTLLWGGGIMGGMAAINGGHKALMASSKWVKENKNNLKPGLKKLYEDSVGKTNIFAENRKALKGNFANTYKDNYLQQKLKQFKLPKFDLTKPQGVKTAEIYKDVQKLLDEAKNLKGDALASKIKEIEIANTKAKIAVQNAKATGEITKNTLSGKAASWLKTKTGVRKAQTKILEGTMSKNKAIKALSKSAKAGGSMFVISAGAEALCNVIPTYKQLGKEKGRKQLGKSLVKVGADTVGFAVGAKVGGIAGAKAGAAIGTFIGGPAGTLVGGVVGTVIGIAGGLLGSWIAGKAAKAVVGKDELEIAQEEQTNEIAKAAETDPELQLQLAAQAQQNIDDGIITDEKDIKDVTESVNKVAENALAQQTTTNSNNNEEVVTQQQFGNYTTDAGLNALFALADGRFNTGFTNYANPMYNPFMTFNNPFMANNQFMVNPFMMNTISNPFMNYYNPFMGFAA